MDDKIIKTNIKKCRKLKKLSQEQMADKLGISRTAYRNFEAGETVLLNPNIISAAHILGTSTETLVLGYTPLKEKKEVRDFKLKAQSDKEKINKTYEAKLDRANNDITQLKITIEALQEAVKSKNDIISLLKREIKRVIKEK